MTGQRFTCPCCGHKTFELPPGSYTVCPVCFWEDDGVQLLDPGYRGGANKPSPMECQANYRRDGACEARFRGNVRPPCAHEPRDPEWRVAREADLHRARTPRDLTDDESRIPATWYDWKRES